MLVWIVLFWWTRRHGWHPDIWAAFPILWWIVKSVMRDFVPISWLKLLQKKIISNWMVLWMDGTKKRWKALSKSIPYHVRLAENTILLRFVSSIWCLRHSRVLRKMRKIQYIFARRPHRESLWILKMFREHPVKKFLLELDRLVSPSETRLHRVILRSVPENLNRWNLNFSVYRIRI